MKICAPLFVLLLAFQGSASAQNSLKPGGQNAEDGYHAGVNRRIAAAVALQPSILLTTFPSFQTESGVRLVGVEIYFVEFQKQFWEESYVSDRDGGGHMDFSKPKGAIRIHHAPVDASVAARIVRIYSKAIADARNSGHGGLDGTSYVFSIPGGACARAWSPEPETRNGRLVELLRRLENHAKFSTPMDLQESEKAIVRYLNNVEGSGSRR